MLDDNFHAPKVELTEFTPIPKGIYQCELLDIKSEVRPTYKTKSEPKEKQVMETILSFQFTLLNGEEKGQSLRGRNVWDNFVPSALYISKKNGKNKLYRIVEALIQRELNQQEEAEGISGKQLNGLIGRQCILNVEPETKGDKTYDVIIDWNKPMSALPSLTAEEKEKAKVKKKDEQTTDSVVYQSVENGHPVDVVQTSDGEQIRVEDIPFN